jgi:DNA-binding response OmpR family regulator
VSRLLAPALATPSGVAAAAPRAAAAPLVCVLGHGEGRDANGLVGWCEALAAEGLAVQRVAHATEAAMSAARAVIMACTQRLPEHLPALREVRQHDTARALVVVCPAPRDLDQVLALEMGADDVIDAAASAPVVAARLRALWRRGGAAQDGAAIDHLAFGRLTLHLRERRAQLGADPVPLTECEFEVLWLLAAQAGRAVSRGELLERLRGLPYQRIDRSIDCRIYRLRAKLRDSDAQHIRTVRNCGYLFSTAPW